MKHLLASLDKLADFDEIIDVRSPLEYADDHIPGAINAPVLSNEERVQVGTLYRQVSPFEASRTGAAIVARNIARHLETTFADRPQGWRPLVYCWRGGKRSGSMTVMFNMIGWRARQLDGGYKTYRGATLQARSSPTTSRWCPSATPDERDSQPRRVGSGSTVGPGGALLRVLRLSPHDSCWFTRVQSGPSANHEGLEAFGRIVERRSGS